MLSLVAKGAAKAQLSRMTGGLGGGGFMGRNFVSPGLRFQGISFHLWTGCSTSHDIGHRNQHLTEICTSW